MVNPACPPWEPYPERKRNLKGKAKRTKSNQKQQVKGVGGKRAKNGSKRGGDRASQNPATDSSFNSFSSSCSSSSESSTASSHAYDGASIAADWLLASPHNRNKEGAKTHTAASPHNNTANRDNNDGRHHHDHDDHRDGSTTTLASRDHVHACTRPEEGACSRRGGCEGGGCYANGCAPGATECEWRINPPDLVLVGAGGDKSEYTFTC